MIKHYGFEDRKDRRRNSDAAAHAKTRVQPLSSLSDQYHAITQANPDLFSLPEGYIEFGNELYNLEIMLSRRIKELHGQCKRLPGRGQGLYGWIKELYRMIQGLLGRNEKHYGRSERLNERFKRLNDRIKRLIRTFSTGIGTFSTLLGTFSTGIRSFSTLLGAFSTGIGTFPKLHGTFSTFNGRIASYSRECLKYIALNVHYLLQRKSAYCALIKSKQPKIKSNIRRYKMSFKKNRLDDFFQNSRDALTNAQNNLQFRTLLTNQNVDDARFLEGFTLLDRATLLQTAKKVKHLEKKKAYGDLMKLRDETQKVYAKHVKFARLCCRNNPGKLLLLGISGEVERKFNLNAWMSQTRFFYFHTIADTDLHPLLLRNGITLTELQDIERKVSDVEQANRYYREKVGEAQTATDDRNQAIREFEFWLSEFIAVCRVATENQPQMLEILKILVYSVGYKKKPKEKTPPAPGEEPIDTPLIQPELAKTRKPAAKKT